MPSFTTHRIVPFSAKQMFDLVADVEAYPAFLPLCEALQVRERHVIDGDPVVVADMTCGYKSIRETFTSRVTLKSATNEILVEYVEGPFRHMRNVWRLSDRADGGCDVRFHIDYAFKSVMLGLLVGSLFEKAFRRFSVAFEERARELYGAGCDGDRLPDLSAPAT